MLVGPPPSARRQSRGSGEQLPCLCAHIHLLEASAIKDMPWYDAINGLTLPNSQFAGWESVGACEPSWKTFDGDALACCASCGCAWIGPGTASACQAAKCHVSDDARKDPLIGWPSSPVSAYSECINVVPFIALHGARHPQTCKSKENKHKAPIDWNYCHNCPAFQ